MSTECSKYCRGCQVETSSLRESLKAAEERANWNLDIANKLKAEKFAVEDKLKQAEAVVEAAKAYRESGGTAATAFALFEALDAYRQYGEGKWA